MQTEWQDIDLYHKSCKPQHVVKTKIGQLAYRHQYVLSNTDARTSLLLYLKVLHTEVQKCDIMQEC